MNPHPNTSCINSSQSAVKGILRVGGFREQQPSSRVPAGFIESMIHVPIRPTAEPKSGTATGRKEAQRRTRPGQPNKWKNSFKPIDEENPDDESQEQSSKEKDELYDPFHPPDLELEDSSNEISCDIDSVSPAEQDDNLEWHRLSPDRISRPIPPWLLGQPLDIRDFSPESRPSKSCVDSPGRPELSEQMPYNPDMKSMGYRSICRSFTPERHIDGSSSLQYSVSFEEKGTTREEEMTRPEYICTRIPRVRLSSPPLQRDYEIKRIPRVRLSSPPLQLDFDSQDLVKEELELCALAKRLKRKPREPVRMDQITINCDLCGIEVSNGQELEKHLESKAHWDTMEHIQTHNTYDDITIAFLQDVMLYKSIKYSQAIDYHAVQALQESDHMTKVSLFHCAACQVLVSTATAAVQNHITSLDHLSNRKEFEAQQRRASLDKADTIIKELGPQFENFIKGFSHFE
ncbi:uncharacterized protein LOC133510459 isoform X2 [Syngnathoides biaculeatus]|uniref:uncharacterized protein LOC133510459 isoform X2 n=1 Tax=Syngnathoides biaculeatus TaxID=300417 RepID=UPI002ADE57D8|nr:uncharacterized protein LOC133510459 isoform X2 [Syngnathoides biaculeatus]